MFCNSTITDLFLFVFTQLILHYLIVSLAPKDLDASFDKLDEHAASKATEAMATPVIPRIFIKFHIILDYFKLLQLLSVHLPCPIFPMEDQHLYVPYDRKPLFDGR